MVQHAYTLIDAGISRLRLVMVDATGQEQAAESLPMSGPIHEVLQGSVHYSTINSAPCFVTGEFGHLAAAALAGATAIEPAAALWASAQALVRAESGLKNLAIIEMSASGYRLLGVNANGMIDQGLFSTHPKCGAGCGVNLVRVLEKLAVPFAEVDHLLARYLGPTGAEARRALSVRADRCGVFSSSATVSDKNQGIPLDFALATTMKSEVRKACSRLTGRFDKVWCTGGIFAWRFARDCAADDLRDRGVVSMAFDPDGSLPLMGLGHLVRTLGVDGFRQNVDNREGACRPGLYPGLTTLRQRLTDCHAFHRLTGQTGQTGQTSPIDSSRPIFIALDVGSTMAKAVIADGQTLAPLLFKAYNNHGDTIETVKHLLRDLVALGLKRPRVQQIAITGSARYQVQKSLSEIYPAIADRVSVLVENYAHARGAIDHIRSHLSYLKGRGVKVLDERQAILVDVGGEDTKISILALDQEELHDNAMNVKCSAGTGSLMDSLAVFFGIKDITTASTLALSAAKAFKINATCAVLLWENARRLQARGERLDEILASSVWAVTENMARSLWNQIDLPANTVTILVGQTMLSDALPLAVTTRLLEHLHGETYGLVPPHPGHNACLGLIRSFGGKDLADAPWLDLDIYLGQHYDKRIIKCRGTACGDPEAVCNRTHLSSRAGGPGQYSFTLGGCSAINELLGRQANRSRLPADYYRKLWREMDALLPRSEATNRLVIPRAFVLSEWAPFFAHFFQGFDLPVHVDNIRDSDVLTGHKYFAIDTCAPHIGAAGQFQRLAGEAHGYILAPQLEFLPNDGDGHGRTCTTNQGGLAVARTMALTTHPAARIHLLFLTLKQEDQRYLAAQLFTRLEPVFRYYGLTPSELEVQEQLVRSQAFMAERRVAIQDRVADILQEAHTEGTPVVLVAGREYILNPGIYDSHVGKLLYDKGMIGIPSYTLGLKLNPEFRHIYWRNSHLLVSLAAAASRREVHCRVDHPRLAEALRRLETATPTGLPLVQVSTFRCGPDSVIAHLMATLMRDRPFLRIQSDAAIKELAHLENRMNTFAGQLRKILEAGCFETGGEIFTIAMLDQFSCDGRLDPEHDVLYFPTMSDNRFLTAILRSAGFICIDNYDDESYNLARLVARGRASVGDTVCAPLAAVYGDVLEAIEDFARRKAAKDPLLAGRRRLLIFNNKGLGPCRQGQYVEVQKLLIAQAGHFNGRKGGCLALPEDSLLQFAVGRENEGFDIGLDNGAQLRGFQAIILQGVTHQLYVNGALDCRNQAELQEFIVAFRAHKQRIFKLLETGGVDGRRPGRSLLLGMVMRICGQPVAGLINHEILRELRRFRQAYKCRPSLDPGRLKFHIEGEVYMRVAQFEEVFRTLLEILGFERFTLTCSPLWSYLDYKIAGQKLRAGESFREAFRRLAANPFGQSLGERLRLCIHHGRRCLRIGLRQMFFRYVLAAPIYQAAGLALPESMNAALRSARRIIPTLRPGGELTPYVGETLLKLQKGYDLVLNVAPEGCMVAGMGEGCTSALQKAAGQGSVQHLFSDNGEVDRAALVDATMKILGPERFYRRLTRPAAADK